MSLFTDTTINGKAAQVSRVYTFTPARRELRSAPDTQFAFRVRCGAIVEERKFRTRDAAEAARADLLAPTAAPATGNPCPIDSDLLDKVVQALMAQQGAGTAAVTWEPGHPVVQVAMDTGTVRFDEDGAYNLLAECA